MAVLRAVRSLDLPDWWIGAGFVRSKVWDVLHDYHVRTPVPDIDVIYFDRITTTEADEQVFQDRLSQLLPDLSWSVTDQARMHYDKHDLPYANAAEGLSTWVETPTCIGVKLTDDDQLILVAPWGIDDLINLKVRANPHCGTNPQRFIERMKTKQWQKKWPKLEIIQP